MPNQVAAPVEADALRRLAEAMNRVHFPATLLHLLLALLAVLTVGVAGLVWRQHDRVIPPPNTP